MTVVFIEEYRTHDKTKWGDGAWQDEPDKAVWIDEETGFDCMIVRNRLGALCGYVGLPPTHPQHGAEYDNVRVPADDDEGTTYPDVHGSLTFASACAETGDPSQFVCHIPQPGRPEDIWWLGFDCAHSMDLVPGMVANNRERYEKAKAEGDTEGERLWSSLSASPWGEQYRDVEYVIREVRRLARQLKVPA